MKIRVSDIPPQGVKRSLDLPLKSLKKLTEDLGEQEGQLEAHLVLKNHQGSVEVTGNMRVALKPPCHRCLDPIALTLDEAVLIYMAPVSGYAALGGEEMMLGRGDLEVAYYEGEELDLAELLEDELLLMLPENVVETDDEDRCLVCHRGMEEFYTNDEEELEAHPFAQMKDWIARDK